MTEKKYLYWMAVSESEPVRFSELAHMMAKAMYPSDAELNHYDSTRANLDSELSRAVRDGELIVRNPAGMGKHTFPYGAALHSAVILPDDLRAFLAERGIELRLTAHGSGPEYWTLENAAIALQTQEGWHGGTRAELLDQLEIAAQRDELTVRDPRTCLPVKSPQARTFWELVTPADVNAWLEKQAAPYRWNVDVPHPQPESYATPMPAAGSAIDAPACDFSMLATRDQLIEAFGRFTGMDAAWFKNLKDTPALLTARKVAGQGGRGHIAEPWFCPFEVMQWLADSKRRKGRKLSAAKAWELLEINFPKVYNARSVADPRTGD